MKKVLLQALVFYQKNISPLKKNCCIYCPSCSEYCKISIEKKGVFFGLLFSVLRIFRCSPAFKCGQDYPSDSIFCELKKYSKFFIISFKK